MSVLTTTAFPTNWLALPANHLLSLLHSDALTGTTSGAVDTTTLAAHDFDVDNRTGFMPPHAPISRLPPFWNVWEDILKAAQAQMLRLGDTPGLSDEEKIKSQVWRMRVRNMPVLSTRELRQSEEWLRRAHHVLAWIFHFYVHTHPPAQQNENTDIIIPTPLTLPLLRVSTCLQLPPVITYADCVLYNWDFATPPSFPNEVPTPSNLRCQTLFTQTITESDFFLVSARIELIGARALDLMRATMDELFVGDDIAVRRITGLLHKLQEVVMELKEQFFRLKKTGFDPNTFHSEVRPWLAGCDPNKRKRVFEGLGEAVERYGRGEDEENIRKPVELSGPSAGQSTLIHSLDIFLGVNRWSHSVNPIARNGKYIKAVVQEPPQDTFVQTSSFLARAQQYMPRHHRRFLEYLGANPRRVRNFVVARVELENEENKGLVDAYNAVVKAVKEFKDAYMVMVTLFIVRPAARVSG